MSVYYYCQHWPSYTHTVNQASASFLAAARAVLDHSDAVSIAQNIQQYQQCFTMLGYPFRTSFQVALGYSGPRCIISHQLFDWICQILSDALINACATPN
jgi:hypothetical protein